ncbi:hypothetical protein J4E83_004046 [Alternaria metachromatica]|uniref:uncharacterized protein n=1 Tax=Alternaria metachromatica TaxID=283354 RepID=UPI0020C1F893|nr:uncharacterized protein J4E83_004046 [Alternaria metachromatica]KAI4624372.1 hypothetical protein J4E83_004046 [Alternaria metachromatica]
MPALSITSVLQSTKTRSSVPIQDDAVSKRTERVSDKKTLVPSAHITSRYDVYDLVARTSTVHVSDLEFIDNWARASVAVMPSSSAFTELPVSNVIRLSITLKLPLAFFRSVERLLGNDPGSSDTESAAQQASLWQRLGSTLGRFKALKKLDLWLDHNETQYWAVVNERLTLDPLLAQLKGLCDLEVTVTLPMLHPRFEKDERHYIDENPSTNARIRSVINAMTLKREEAIPAYLDERAPNGVVPVSAASLYLFNLSILNHQCKNIDDLAAFIHGYKQLQHDTIHLRSELAGRDHTHAQAITQLRQASEHQNAEHAATITSKDEEMQILRREKESLREGIEDLQFDVVPVNDEVARLRIENAKLRRAATLRAFEIKGLHIRIKDCNKSLESYKK